LELKKNHRKISEKEEYKNRKWWRVGILKTGKVKQDRLARARNWLILVVHGYGIR
jgi:hypothetical protein